MSHKFSTALRKPAPVLNRFKHLAFTPTALNSKAQRRAAHAGVPIAPMIEPQRGSTNHETGCWMLDA